MYVTSNQQGQNQCLFLRMKNMFWGFKKIEKNNYNMIKKNTKRVDTTNIVRVATIILNQIQARIKCD